MTQLPPTPPPMSPAPGYSIQPKKTNGLALASLITAIAGFCLWFVGGIVAIVLGILALRKTKEQGGKGMAIAGIVIGLVSMLVPILFFGGIFGAVMAGTSAGRETARDWMVATSAGDIEKAVSLSHPQFPREDIQAIADYLKPLGAFKDMTSSNINLNNNQLDLTGTATFDGGTKSYKIIVTDMGGGSWKLQKIEIN